MFLIAHTTSTHFFPFMCMQCLIFPPPLQRLLNSFIDKLFSPKSFEGDFTLVPNLEGAGKKIAMPDSIRSVEKWKLDFFCDMCFI